MSLKHRFMPAVLRRLGCPLVVARETNINWRNLSLGQQQCVFDAVYLCLFLELFVSSKTQPESL